MARLFDDAQSEYLEIDQAVLSGTPLAIVCFFYIDTLNRDGSLISLADKDVTRNYHFLIVDSDNKLRAQTDDSEVGDSSVSAFTTDAISINTWHHGCALFVDVNDRRVFLDATGKGTNSDNKTPAGLDRTSVGRTGRGNSGLYTSGCIAEAAIYDLSDLPGATNSDKADYFEANILPGLVAGNPPDRYLTGLAAYWELRTSSLEDEIGEFDLTANGTSVSSNHPPIVRYMVSSVAGVSTVSGSLDSQLKLIGSAVGSSAADGNITGIWTNRGEIVEASGTVGFLNINTELGSSVTEISSAGASLGSLGVLTLIVAPTVGTPAVSGSLDVATKLIGEVISGVSVTGYLGFLISIKSSVVGITTIKGFLNAATKLRGSIVEGSSIFAVRLNAVLLASSVTETPNISGSLSVVTKLSGFVVDTSDSPCSLSVIVCLQVSSLGLSTVSGFINLQSELEGSIIEDSVAFGSLDSQPELGFDIDTEIAADSDIDGYLSIIPDFNAATLFWRPQNEILETLEWKTSVLKANDGTEQRIKIRWSPRQYFRLRLLLETNKINTWFDSVLHTWQKQQWLLPIWTELVGHTADIDSHDTVIEVNTTYADFRNSDKAMVWKSASEYEIIVVDTKTDSQLNLSYSMLNSFSGNKYIVPVRTAYMISSSKKEIQNSPLSFVDLIFAVYDNINLSDEINISSYRYQEDYDYLTLLATPAFMDLIHVEDSDGDIIIIDFGTGIFRVESDSDFNFLSQNHVFFSDSKESCWKFRQFLHSLNGRQKTVLIPTFRDDVTQAATIEELDTSVDIDNIKLAENMGLNVLRTYIGFYFPATGSLIIRKIIDIVEIDSNTERISFNAVLNYGSSIESGDCKICFVDKCRLASDKIEMFWPNAHKNECKVNFTRVK